MNDTQLYWRYITTSIKSQLQYRMSFVLSSIGQLTATSVEIAGIWALFTRFGNLENWSLAQVCLFYGTVNIAFALADALSPGFDFFGTHYIRTGQFDRLLVRPRSVVVQLLGHELALRRVGRLIQGMVVFIWACIELQLEWHGVTVYLFVFAIIGSTCLFLGLMVFQATLAFWTVESLEIMNTLTYGGAETAQYPLEIYASWFRQFFTFIVPLACVTYLPVIGMLGIADPLGSPYWLQLVSPFAGVVFLLVAIVIFNSVGVRHYTSTGS
jgi:ABC-2 type transport system permease protein